jgi:hypothetical protein
MTEQFRDNRIDNIIEFDALFPAGILLLILRILWKRSKLYIAIGAAVLNF